MSKTIRYSLIALGFLIFLIGAPLIVLYVRGITYDFKEHEFVQTGILGVRVNPNDAEVYLNGRLLRRGSGDVDFLPPAEYQVTLKKPGYFDWGKRLAVAPGQVTWANPENQDVHMLLAGQAAKELSSGVSDFYFHDNFLGALSGNSFAVWPSGPDKPAQNYPLPQPVQAILAAGGQGEFILGGADGSSTLLFFNAADGRSADLSSLFSSPPQFQITDSGEVDALEGHILYRVDPEADSKTVLLTSVKAFFNNGTGIYYVREDQGAYSLLLLGPDGRTQTLLAGLPAFEQGQLLVNFEKQIFLLADGTLYRANAAMEKIADHVTAAGFNFADSYLALFHLGELDSYDYFGQNLSLVTRSSENLTHPLIDSGGGYAFYLKSNGLYAIELDARDNQNLYLLYQGRDIKNFTLNSAGNTAMLLDGDRLKILKLR
ncbi:MAG TPA: PEGA domain-containing protein [Patescibacteria group bacterium]|nr:PEGA domain-containing protein [Patescibacteria group bacterium]